MESEFFPSEWVLDILVKLPVKSIIRFECVAKTWYHLFRTSRFVSQHRSVSKNNKNKLSLIRYHHCNTKGDNASFVMSKLDLDDQTVTDFRRPLSDIDSSFSHVCVDNGLACVHSRHPHRITIWNPATREFRILPQFGDIIPGDTFEYVAAFGFALDPLSNDYKVVYIRRCRKAVSKTDGKWIAQYGVYHMSTDSWRVLKKEDDKFVNRTTQYWSKNTCVNGVLYFIVRIDALYTQSGWIENWILAFDLGADTSRFIQSPMPYAPEGQGMMIQLRDNPLGFWDTTCSRVTYGLWVLNNDQESWTKLRKIEPRSEITFLYGFWNNGKVFVRSWSEKVLVYELETGKFTKTGIQIKTGEREIYNIYPYEETLLYIRRRKKNKGAVINHKKRKYCC